MLDNANRKNIIKILASDTPHSSKASLLTIVNISDLLYNIRSFLVFFNSKIAICK